jgi:N-acetylglucosamine-6-phosphate deacetylase
MGEEGVAAMVPAVYPASLNEMREALSAVREAMSIKPEKGAARILGAHLEGPFVNFVKAGALDNRSFLPPTLSNLKKLVDGFEDLIRIITVAPEMKGALKVIERCVSMGMRVNMGHSDANFAQARDGKRAGAMGVTHLFNAMRPFHHREPGLAGFALFDEDLYVELIADGLHVRPEVLKMVFDLKSHDRIMLVSDSVKGPQYKAGVLQGAKAPVTKAETVLLKARVPKAAIRLAMRAKPARYMGLD